MKRKIQFILYHFFFLLLLLLLIIPKNKIELFITEIFKESYAKEEIPLYSGSAYIILNHNEPLFTDSDYHKEVFASYSNLDILGRCGVAFAKIGPETMPSTKRESIGSIRPSGFQISKYDFIEGKYLYNRCHLLAYQLTGENANPKNLITCTRSMNAKTMLYFENQVASYIRKTKNHVLYRVTPVFEKNNLVATGVVMEALSIEDYGEGIRFHIFVYNVEDGVLINYLDGSNQLKK